MSVKAICLQENYKLYDYVYIYGKRKGKEKVRDSTHFC